MRLPIPQKPILVISSPSGGGKTTLRRKLLAEKGTDREFMISYTTRMPRADEIPDVDYHFLALKHITPANMLDPTAIAKATALATQEFDNMVMEGDILFEQTTFYGNRYGTPRVQLDDAMRAGKQVIVDVNREGLDAFKSAYPNHVRSIFLKPPSLDVLASRLQTRIDEEPMMNDLLRASLMKQNEERMRYAKTTMSEAPFYDHMISSAGTPQQTFEAVKAALSEPLQPKMHVDLSSLARHYTVNATAAGKSAA